MSSIHVSDQVGRKVFLLGQAQKIICLVPSITELLFHLGLGDYVIGRTQYCVIPMEALSKPVIGGTKAVRFDKILALEPDLIIANKEENTEEIVTKCEQICSVYVSNVQTIHSAINMITDIGQLTGTSTKAENLVQQIESKREKWHLQNLDIKTCLYLIWKEPYMTIGVDTYIYHMLQEMGLENCLYDFRYPTLSVEKMRELAPKYILLSSEPFTFSLKDVDELSELIPDSTILLVDGTYFSWYGNRIEMAYDYFGGLLQKLI